jgi:hypothetical protein
MEGRAKIHDSPESVQPVMSPTGVVASLIAKPDPRSTPEMESGPTAADGLV